MVISSDNHLKLIPFSQSAQSAANQQQILFQVVGGRPNGRQGQRRRCKPICHVNEATLGSPEVDAGYPKKNLQCELSHTHSRRQTSSLRRLGACQGVSDVEDDHADNRTVGAERAEGGARPAVAGDPPAAGAGRAALGRASLAEAVPAEARGVLLSLADLCWCADGRPIDRRNFERHASGARVSGTGRDD